MTIRARYAGVCTVCGQRFAVGAEIEWSRDAGSRHAACPTPAPVDAKSESPAQILSDIDAAAFLEASGVTWAGPLVIDPARPWPLKMGDTVEGVRLGTAYSRYAVGIDWGGAIVDPAAESRRRSLVVDLATGDVTDRFAGRDADVLANRAAKAREFAGRPQSFTTLGTPRLGDAFQSVGGQHYMIVSVGARYYHSADDCEDFDCFCGEYGWTTPYEARKVTEPAAVREAREARETTQRAAAAAVEQEKAEYPVWQAEITAGLVKTTVVPRFYTQASGRVERDADGWATIDGVRSRPLRSWSKAVGWYTTGDQWYEAVLPTGERVVACYYGNAVLYYVPQDVAERWYMERWEERRAANPATAARAILADAAKYPDGGVYGWDYQLAILRLVGEDALAEAARQEEWWYFNINSHLAEETHDLLRARQVAARYGLEIIVLGAVPYAERQRLVAPLGDRRHSVSGVYRHLDGRHFAYLHSGEMVEV